ncbi:MRH4 [Candida pseudojiufengensis]|uniref:MRH4 n=1 Tax=Candida pseudojiufengensis TaxID=497109 RepID=UPI002224A9D6|nr:MRH4 [Candida pseudojiufengensis]KAI5963147.1 MRH4 [Candida pseudojiufengensis]
MINRFIRHDKDIISRFLKSQFSCQCRHASRYSSKIKIKSSRLKSQKTTKSNKDSNGSPTSPPTKSDSNKSRIFETGKFSQLYNSLKSTNTQDPSLQISKINDFNQLKIFPSVREAMIKEIKSQYNLKGPQYSSIDQIEIKPTPIQVAAIKKINQTRSITPASPNLDEMEEGERILYELKNENESKKTKVFTISSETGSGKTWSYLSVLLSKLKEDDLNWFKTKPEKYEAFKKSQQIRSIIMVPTNELVDQIYETLHRANKFSLEHENVNKKYIDFLNLPENESLGFSIMKLSQGDPSISLYKQLKNYGKIDILVTTPAKFTSLSKIESVDRPFKIFKSVKYCILDESDTLFDPSFIKDTTSVVKNFPNLLDLILVSATIPKEFEKQLKILFPEEKSIIRISTPGLHKIPKKIKIFTLDSDLQPYNGSKVRCLAQTIYAISKDGTEPDQTKRIIIFVNSKDEVDELVETLKDKYSINEEDIFGISSTKKVQDRKDILSPFLKPAQPINDSNKSKINILVTTDLLSRGLNFSGIKNIILMGLPRNSIDLVHRIGRTGRMNQSGRVFIIVDKKSKKSWVKGLGNAIIKGLKIG